MDYVKQFQAFMAQNGFAPQSNIVADSKFHRFSTNGKASDTAGWYVLNNNISVPAGAFGNWRTDESYSWSADEWGSTPEDQAARRAVMDELIATAAVERARIYDETAEKAKSVWDSAKPAPPDHPYLVGKRIGPQRLRIAGNRLVVSIGRFDTG